MTILNKFETKNLIIKISKFDDCKEFYKWEKQENVSQFFSMNSDRTYEDLIREFIKQDESPSDIQYTIFDIKENPIGRLHINHLDMEKDTLNINRIYIGDEKNRRKGFGEEVLKTILEYAFKNLHMERVTLSFYEGNKVASNLYAKMGFTIEGLARNATKKDGKYFNLYSLSLLRGEYIAKKK